jgi:hypothetical protein
VQWAACNEPKVKQPNESCEGKFNGVTFGVGVCKMTRFYYSTCWNENQCCGMCNHDKAVLHCFYNDGNDNNDNNNNDNNGTPTTTAPAPAPKEQPVPITTTTTLEQIFRPE